MLGIWAKRAIFSVMMAISCSAAASVAVVSHTDEYQHADSAGGKGKDSIKLVAPQTPSGECAVFGGAELVYKKRRYGEATIVKQPENGCNPAATACRLDVSWEHEPAGRLNYRVKVDWKVQSGC